jgi:hypothetical protein
MKLVAAGRIVKYFGIVQVALLQQDLFKTDPNIPRLRWVVDISPTWASIFIDINKQLTLVELPTIISSN